MGVSIQGIRVDSVTISNKPDDGEDKVQGNYSLISNSGKVLAKQSFNTYNEIKVNLPTDTVKAMNDFMKKLKRDIETVLGMDE